MQFESGHPDGKPAPVAGSIKNKLAHFGALEYCDHFGFSGEKAKNQICEQMLKSMQLKDYNGNPNKRWYIEYREYNPITSEFDRIREYGGINREKCPIKRKVLLNDLYARLSANITLRFSVQNQHKVPIVYHINQYLQHKGNVLREKSIKNIKHSLQMWQKFLSVRLLTEIQINQVNRQHARDFRIWLSGKVGNRSVNNHIGFVASFFEYYKKNYEDLVPSNPFSGIGKLPNTSETHVAYSTEQLKEIFAYLAEHDPQMLLYCQFIGLGFVRCDEARNLKIGDIDFQRRTITLTAGNAKARRRTVKPMLGKFYELILAAGLHKYDRDNYIFTIQGKPGRKQAHYNYFQKRYKPLKKVFGLTPKHTIYSFRHSFVCQLLDSNQAWTEIMKYTGHTTMDAFQKYARSLGNKPARDLSDFVSF